ncbi:hypothetical protein BDF21DRAFT_390464 [Thamnidium elegans]|nr:hypothetical protein BDF21DRAFT_390464 [Thamnidium elegans]
MEEETRVIEGKGLHMCPLCESNKEFSNLANVKRHIKVTHKLDCANMKKNYKSKGNQSEENKNDSIYYVCCGCFVTVNSLDLYQQHFKGKHITVKPNTSESDGSLMEPDHMISPSLLPSLPETNQSPPPSATQLLNQLQLPVLGNDTACNIIRLLGYEPVSYGNEEDNIWLPYFSTRSTIKRSLELQEKFPNKVMKMLPCKPENDDTSTQVPLPYSHDYIIQHSPYNRQLSHDSFIPLNQNHIDILNTTWNKKKYMKSASLQLLAGSVIVTNFKAIMVNCLEVYSRIPSLEAHAEKEESYLENSLPTTSSQYSNLSIVKLNNDNSNNLIIGTEISNFLVTSSIRLDDDSILPELGPTTAKFDVTNATRIYISKDSITKYNQIIESKMHKYVMKHEVYNLKQVRSKFHRPSIYSYSRGFSLFTHSLNNVPVTVFTARDCKYISNKEAKVASGILQEVAWCVLEGDGKLDIINFKSLISSLPKDANATFSLCVKSIEKMYDNEEHLQVINNSSLNSVLEILANFVSNNGITLANKKIAETVRDIFKS